MTALVTENLPLLAGAPNGISKVRELVLDLAVRGKLSEQQAEDGCASDLIVQIEYARSSLTCGGLLKAQKELPEVTPKDARFGIPGNWVWTRLGSITNFGTTDKRGAIGPDSWILDLEDIEKDTSKLLRKLRFAERQSLSDKNGFATGDVLYGKLRPYLNKVIVADEPGFCTTEILPFRCHGPWHAGYFKIALQSPYFLSYVNGKSYGMKMPRLGTEDGRMAVLPLPPLAEQHRIVAKVDELMALCDRLEAQQADAEAAKEKLVEALLASLIQARDAADFRASWQQLAEHFHTLFTTEDSVGALKQTVMQLGVDGRLCAGDARSTWRLQTINEFCTVQGGIQKTPLRAPVRHHFPYLRVANVQRGRIDIAHMERYELAPEELQRWRLNAGDLLIVEGNGSESEIGRCAIWHGEVEDCVYQNHLMRVRPTGDDAVEYLALYLNSPVGAAHMRRLAITTSGLFNLSVGKIRSIPVELPPPSEQHRIVAKVGELLGLCDQLKQNLATARQSHEHLASVLVEQAVA